MERGGEKMSKRMEILWPTEERQYLTLKKQVTIELRQDFLDWLQSLIERGLFQDLSNFILSAIQDFCLKLKKSGF